MQIKRIVIASDRRERGNLHVRLLHFVRNDKAKPIIAEADIGDLSEEQRDWLAFQRRWLGAE